jgi:hypothetical protein
MAHFFGQLAAYNDVGARSALYSQQGNTREFSRIQSLD